jgi:hypothetical protein
MLAIHDNRGYRKRKPLLSGIQTSASESRRNILDDQLEPVHVDYATPSKERILLRFTTTDISIEKDIVRIRLYCFNRNSSVYRRFYRELFPVSAG